MEYLRSLGLVDILITILLALFLIHGLRGGFIRALFGLLSIGAGWVVASRFHLALASRWSVARPEAEVALRLGVFVLLFLVTALAVRLVGIGMTGAVAGTPLSLLNRLLGGICGVFVGAVVVGVLFLVADGYFPGSARAFERSRYRVPLTSIARVLSRTLPDEMQKRLKGREEAKPAPAAGETASYERVRAARNGRERA
jgi:membrane protein required for colicin V production